MALTETQEQAVDRSQGDFSLKVTASVKRAQAAEICKGSCLLFPMPLCSGAWHRVTLAALRCTASHLVQTLCSKSSSSQAVPWQRGSCVPRPGLGAECALLCTPVPACQARELPAAAQAFAKPELNLKGALFRKKKFKKTDQTRSYHFSV